MKLNIQSPTLRLPLLALAIGLLPALPAQAADIKTLSTAACQPYTSSPIDPALLRVRADGIINDYPTSKFVICPILKDSDNGWSQSDPDSSYVVSVAFRRLSGSPLTSNQCTLTAGWNASDPLQSVTKSAEPFGDTTTYGLVQFPGGPNTVPDGYGVLVCRIAPGNQMDLIHLVEISPTETNL